MKRYLLGAAVLVGAVGGVFAQAAYPSRPIKLVVAYAAGGAPDTMARVYLEKLKELVSQPIIVENKPGATGSIGADFVAKAPPDGYTLLMNSSALVVNAWTMPQSFDIRKDFVPVVRTATTPYLMTVSPHLPVKDFDEFVAYAKKNPGKIACGTYGPASPPHLHLELLKKELGLDIVHVPYKSFLPALTDLLSGQLQCSIDPPTIPVPHVQAGKIRAIAHTGDKPMALFKDITPIGARYPATKVVGWQAVLVHSATPPAIVAQLRADWQKVIENPEIGQKIRSYGFDPGGGSVEAFAKDIVEDYEKFGRVIRESNIKLE